MIKTLDVVTGNATYLEIGAWAGSTACSAIAGNRVTATIIDNWSQFGGPVASFFQNISQFITSDTRVSILNKDFRSIQYETLGHHDVYLFDGPHSEKDHHDGISLALPALSSSFVLIIDDWNWKNVRNGTLNAISISRLSIKWEREIRTTENDMHPGELGLPTDGNSEWHNGYFIAVLEKSF